MAGNASPDTPATASVPAAAFVAVSPDRGTYTEVTQGRPRRPYGPLPWRPTGEMQGSVREKCAGLW